MGPRGHAGSALKGISQGVTTLQLCAHVCTCLCGKYLLWVQLLFRGEHIWALNVIFIDPRWNE